LKLKSYAKLNLYLEVLNIRSDSYHNLVTLFERISLYDEILLTPRLDKEIKLLCAEPRVPSGKRNLALRAAALLRKVSGIDKGADIKIIKHIPVAAGLGGGSSNAATVLLGLNRLWRLNFSREKLTELARELGADVPFFLYDASFALGRERGDRIMPLSVMKRRLWHILIVPRFLVSTFSIYKALDKQRKTVKIRDLTELTKALNNVKILSLALKKGSTPLEGAFLFNRLEEVTLKRYPQIKKIKDKLSNLGVRAVLMSGSGPAVFGVVSSRKEGESLCRFFKRSGNESFVVRTV